MTFYINHKAYTVDLGDDKDKSIENGIKKFLDLEKNLEEKDLLLAYIKKTHELVELEKTLEKLVHKIDEK
jgi:hypothetical protein